MEHLILPFSHQQIERLVKACEIYAGAQVAKTRAETVALLLKNNETIGQIVDLTFQNDEAGRTKQEIYDEVTRMVSRGL